MGKLTLRQGLEVGSVVVVAPQNFQYISVPNMMTATLFTFCIDGYPICPDYLTSGAKWGQKIVEVRFVRPIFQNCN